MALRMRETGEAAGPQAWEAPFSIKAFLTSAIARFPITLPKVVQVRRQMQLYLAVVAGWAEAGQLLQAVRHFQGAHNQQLTWMVDSVRAVGTSPTEVMAEVGDLHSTSLGERVALVLGVEAQVLGQQGQVLLVGEVGMWLAARRGTAAVALALAALSTTSPTRTAAAPRP